ncbi:hypothetical protein Bpfe_008363, partial [Biomphalaria pfeifferi]
MVRLIPSRGENSPRFNWPLSTSRTDVRGSHYQHREMGGGGGVSSGTLSQSAPSHC